MSLYVSQEGEANCGDDHISAVNLTRPIEVLKEACGVEKETYLHIKRGLRVLKKRHACISKEACVC